MDLQLEWMTLEDFQKYFDGEDENFFLADVILSSAQFWNYGDFFYEIQIDKI